MKIIKFILIALVVMFFIGLFINWTEARDAKLMAAVDKYEKCVEEKFGMGVMDYYYSHGEQYPECSNEDVTVEYKK